MFTYEDEIVLIKLVSENPALYDPKHKDYRSQYVRDRLWRQFGTRLNKTVAKRRKYASIGDEYLFAAFGDETLGPWGPGAHGLFHSLKKRLKNTHGDKRAGSYLAQRLSLAMAIQRAEDCKKKWKCIRDAKNRFKKDSKSKHRPMRNSKDERHKLLSFISSSRHSPVRSKHEEEDTMSSNPLSPHSDEQYFDSDEINQGSASSSRYRESVEVAVKPEFVTDEPNEYEEIEQIYRRPGERHHEESNENELIKRLSESEETWQKLKTLLNKKEDDIDLFCRYIGQVLKSLPPMQRAEAKKQLGEIVCNYEIKAATAALDIKLL